MEEKGILFTNWTNEDFSHNWNSEEYTFKARSSKTIAEGSREHNIGLANFFAKHLTDREMNRINMPTNHFSRHEFTDKCFVPIEVLVERERESLPQAEATTSMSNDMAVTPEVPAVAPVPEVKKAKAPKVKKSDKEGFVAA